MTAELWLLVGAVVLTVVQAVIAVVGAITVVGIPALAGNREDVVVFESWIGRAQRAHRNMLESLPLFAILVLVAHLAGVGGGLALLGAQIFFWARVVHAVVYLAGIPWLRTGVWSVSIVGLVLMLVALF